MAATAIEVVNGGRSWPRAAFEIAPVAAKNDSYDADLDWILARYVEGTMADGGLVVRCFDDSRPAALVLATGTLDRDRDCRHRLVTALEASPVDRRRSTDRAVQVSWTAIEGNPLVRALSLVVPGDRGERIVATVAYVPESTIDDAVASAMGDRLAPLLEGYLRLWLRHRTERRRMTGLAATLDLSTLAVLVLDLRGELAFTNRAATTLLDRSDGLRRNGRSVAATDLGSAMRLQVAIHHILAEQGVGCATARRHAPILPLARPGGTRPLVVTVLPVDRAAIEPGDPALVLHVLDPEADVSGLVRPVCKLYGLSPVETRLAIHLVLGATLADAAQSMRVKEQTARAYLKQVFQKTETNRQTDLVRLLLSSVTHVCGEVDAITV